MAVLTTQERNELTAEIMDMLSRKREALPGTLKADLKAAVGAADDWIEANGAAYSAALPDPFKTQSSVNQKSRLWESVLNKRNRR